MKKRLQHTVLLVAGLFTSSAWSGCTFYWQNYGSNAIHAIIEKQIGSEISDKFCPYAKDYQVTIVTDYFMGSNGCTGYASAGLRKTKSKKMPQHRTSRISNDTACSNYEYSHQLAAEAAVLAVRGLMIDMDDHLKSAQNLN